MLLPGIDPAFGVTIAVLGFSRWRWLHSPSSPWIRSFQPPHSANRHDAGCRGAGADRVGYAINRPRGGLFHAQYW